MMYRSYTTEIPLPNRNYGLHDVQSLTIDLQKNEAAPRRSASTRITHTSHPQYYVIDPTPQEPAYASFIGFEQAGPSHLFQQEHTV